jgi:hypothetical protein
MTRLSQHRAAKHLGIAASTLSSYVKRGIAPPHVTMLGVCYFEVAGLDAWLNARRGGV